MPRPPYSEAQREAMRSRILDAAWALLQTHGPKGLSTRGIASVVGVSAMALYTYFPNRGAILQALAERETASFRARQRALEVQVAQGADPATAVRQSLELFIELEHDHPDLFHLAWVAPEAAPDGNGMERARSRQQQHVAHLATLIRAGMQSAAFRVRDPFLAAAAVLGAPPNVIPLVVQPGITMSELAAKAATIPGHSRGSFLQAAAAVAPNSPFAPAGETSLEGLLGLGRYLVRPGETDRQVLTAMERRFTAEAQNLDLTGAAAALGITPYQAIIVASIVQKEAFTSGASSAVGMANAPKVARVIYNRLAAGMALQMDSTVLYAENRDGGPVSRQDLSLASPYNTYRTPGLTPTPICFPSTQALQAALHPAAGPWLYFVLTSADGAETFSSTLAQQLQAEAVARRRGLP